MQNKKIWKIIMILSLIGLLICVGLIGWYIYQNHAAQKGYEKVQEQVEEEPEEDKPTLEEVENVEFTGERDGEAAKIDDKVFRDLDLDNPIDFDELTAINSDLYAWVRVPNTAIDYPVAQRADDDSYYLSHDMYHEPRFAGCIYTEAINAKDFSDPNTVMYGHNMRNGSMFQNLHLFEDPTFFDENPYIYVYTADKVRVYEIFAAYTYDDRHILNSFDNFRDTLVFQNYLDEIKNVRSMSANYREDVVVTAQDHILTLATCSGGDPGARLLVQGVLIEG